MFLPVTFNQPALAWAAPLALLGLLIGGILIRRYQLRFLGRFGQVETLRKFSVLGLNRRGFFFLALAAASALLAAAEPVSLNGGNLASRTLNAVIVLDVSRSMLAEDTPAGQSRTALAREAIRQLLEEYPQGNFGLVVISKRSQSYALTNDHEALRILLEYNGDPYRARDEGSDLPAGLTAAAELIADSPIPVETVILITDGGGLETGPVFYRKPLQALLKLGVNVLAAGVGGTDPVPIPVRNSDGSLKGYHSKSGVLLLTFRNDMSLRHIAGETNGFRTTVREGGDLVEAVRAHNLANQPVFQGGEVSLAHLPLLASLFFLVLFLLEDVRNVLRRRFLRRSNRG